MTLFIIQFATLRTQCYHKWYIINQHCTVCSYKLYLEIQMRNRGKMIQYQCISCPLILVHGNKWFWDIDLNRISIKHDNTVSGIPSSEFIDVGKTNILRNTKNWLKLGSGWLALMISHLYKSLYTEFLPQHKYHPQHYPQPLAMQIN